MLIIEKYNCLFFFNFTSLNFSSPNQVQIFVWTVWLLIYNLKIMLQIKHSFSYFNTWLRCRGWLWLHFPFSSWLYTIFYNCRWFPRLINFLNRSQKGYHGVIHFGRHVYPCGLSSHSFSLILYTREAIVTAAQFIRCWSNLTLALLLTLLEMIFLLEIKLSNSFHSTIGTNSIYSNILKNIQNLTRLRLFL